MHGFDIIADWKDKKNQRVIETNYGFDTKDRASAAAVKRCNELGPNYIYKLFKR